VLAGRGAAGMIHVGVIHELERLGISLGCVVGSSMAANIAGLYPSVYSAHELEEIALAIDCSSTALRRYLKWSF
jgi:predicted acylesterase/phospholipase RssA